MSVSPYPARIYFNATPGIEVLTVRAFDNTTGERINEFRLEEKGISEYFHIGTDGVIRTAKTINREIGFQFQFFVFAVKAPNVSQNLV